MTFKRLVISLLLIMVLCVSVVAYVVTFHAEDLQETGRALLARSFGEHVVIEDMHVSLFPYPQLELRDVHVNDPERGNRLFHASRIQLDLSFLSLLQERPMPNALIIEDAVLDLARDANGQWNYRNVLAGESIDGTGKGAWLYGRSLKLLNGSIRLSDHYRRETAFRLQAEEVELHVERLVLDGPTEVFLSARLSERDPGSLVSSYGTLQDLGGLLKTDSVARREALPQFDLHTRVELDRKTLLQLAELFNVREVPVGERIKAEGQIRFAPGLQGYDLTVSDLAFLADGVALNADVSMTRLFDPEPPIFSGQWTSAPIAIDRLTRLLPRELVPLELNELIDRQTISGKIRAVSATWTGSTRKEVGSSLTGEFQLSEGTIHFGPKLGNAQGITCSIHVEPNRIRLVDIQGDYEQIPVTQGAGEVVVAEEGSWFTLEIGGRVSPQEIMDFMQNRIALSLHPITSLQGKAGDGLLLIRFAGPPEDPGSIAFQDAEYHPERVSVQLPGLKNPLKEVKGMLEFSRNHLRFENVTGLYGQSDFHVQGNMRFEQRAYFDDMNVQGRFSDDDLLSLVFDQSQLAQRRVSGKAEYLVMVTGSMETPAIHGRVALQGLELLVPGILYKPPALPGNLDFRVQIGHDHRLTVERMLLTLASVRLAGQGEVSYDRTLTFNASLETESIRFESLPPELELFDKAIASGTLKGAVTLQGTGSDWRSWDKSGWLAFTNGVVRVRETATPLSALDLQVTLDGHAAELKRLQWNFGDSQIKTTGSIQTWDSQPKMNLNLTVSRFDIDLLVPKDKPSPLRTLLENVAKSAEVSTKIRFDHAWYHDLRFQELTGHVRIKNSVIGIDHVQGTIDDGTIQGRLLIHMPVERPASIKTWFKVDRIPLVNLQQTFFDKETLEKRLVTGLLSAEGMLQGHGRNQQGILQTIKGRLKLSTVNGRIKRGTVLPKILAIMNLPSLLQGTVDLEKDGYPFDRQTGTLVIADGRVVSEDIVIDGPILKMTAAGEYDMVKNELNVVTAASPLGSYFDLLQKIPLVHLLLDGEERGLDMIMFSVRGSLHDPTIESMPMESFAFGLTGFARLAFTILKNTITLPQKMFSFEDDEASDSQRNDLNDQESEDLLMEQD